MIMPACRLAWQLTTKNWATPRLQLCKPTHEQTSILITWKQKGQYCNDSLQLLNISPTCQPFALPRSQINLSLIQSPSTSGVKWVTNKGAPMIVISWYSFWIVWSVVSMKADQKSWSDDAKHARQFLFTPLKMAFSVVSKAPFTQPVEGGNVAQFFHLCLQNYCYNIVWYCRYRNGMEGIVAPLLSWQRI